MKFLFISFISLCISLSSVGQNFNNAMTNFVPPSPSAAALGKFGDIPVSYSTGIPNITIPIYRYEDKANGLNLNVSLDYHAGGIRVTEKASNVGIGWALNAGGVINRETRGGPDEGMPGTTGYWAADALPDITAYRNNSNLYGTNITSANPYFSFYKSMVDAQPDVFSFNFNGHSGRFVIGKNNQVYIWPQQQLQITKSGVIGNLSFTIVAEDGMTYVFDQQETTQMPTISGTLFAVGTSWYVSKIISPFSVSEIDFSYQTVAEDYQVKSSQTWYKSTSGNLVSSSASSLGDQSIAGISSRQLSQISFPGNINVNFIYDNVQRCDVLGDYALSKIEITDGVNTKGFRMDHDYSFGLWSGSPVSSCSGIDQNTARLVLHQVTEYSGAMVKPPFVMEYNNSVALPGTFSYAQDHWGFFNGAYNNGSLLPLDGAVDFVNYSPTSGIDNADRRTSPANALAGSLSKLTYPTGGSTTFTFESNDVPDDGSVTYINQPAMAVINGTDPSKSTFFTLSTNTSVTTFQFAFGGFSSANSGCSITASIVSIDESKIYASVILGPGTGYSKSADAVIPPGQYKYKYVFGTQCVPELFVVNLQWTNKVLAPQALKDYVGGLRIKKIEDRTGPNDASIMTKEYSYLLPDGQTSSGAVAVRPAYSYGYSESCSVPDGNPCPSCAGANAAYNVLGSTSLFTLANALGSPVQYSRVEEKFTGDGSGNNGRIVRYFNSTATNGFILPYDGSNPGFFGFPYITPETPEWIYGLLSDDSTYDKDNNLKQSTHNEYSLLSSSLDSSIRENFKGIKVLASATVYSCTKIADIRYLLNDYFPYTGRSELARSSQTTYGDNGIAVVTTTDYQYDPAYFTVRKVTTTDSKGVVYENRQYYPFDIVGGISSEMTANHIYSLPITKEKWKINSDPTQNQLVGDEVTEYDKFNNNAFIKPSSIDVLNTSSPVGVSVIGNFNPNALIRNTNYIKQEVQLGNYDSKGNVLQQLGKNGIPEAYMWGYNQSRLVAKVSNASNTLVQYYVQASQSGSLVVPTILNGSASSAFSSYYSGNVDISISFNGPPSANAVGRISYSLSGPVTYTGALCVSSGSSSLCSGLASSISVPNVPAGTYSLSIVTNVNSDVAAGSSVVVSYDYPGRSLTSTGIREFFYQSFEEEPTATAANKYAGSKSFAGNYQVPYTMPNSRSYLVDYHYYNGSQWIYVRKPYTNNMILSDGPYIDEVRVYPGDAEMSTFTYQPLLGVTSSTDLNGKATFYEYDGLGRLLRIRDKDSNIVKQYDYQYQAPAVYFNTVKSGTYARACSTGGTGSTVTYTVAAGTYRSGISQADADARAQNDVTTNGQNYANTNGTCTFYNTSTPSGTYTRACSPGGTGSSVTYTVAAGAYASTISQADANQQATNAVTANGQNYANAHGTCTFYNVAESGTYTCACGTGGTGSAVTYTVAAGAYSSTVDQTTANQLALNDVSANGQSYANAHGTCIYYNTAQSGTYTRNNCTCVYTGSSVTYTVAANTYNSSVSLAAANQLATNDVTTNGPNYANAHGTCTTTCINQGQRIISCACQMGTMVCTSSVYNSSTKLYTITYHYTWTDGSSSQNYSMQSGGPCMTPP